jgi:hypothetical protein
MWNSIDMTRTPRQAFIESPHKIEHAKTVNLESFHVACEYSLLALLQEQPEATDPSKGWDSHSQMIGARRVLEILKSLHQVEEVQKPVKPPTLNYRA